MDSFLPASVVAEITKQGPLGLVVVCLLFVSYRLFNLYVDAQEKRIAASAENREAIVKNTETLQNLTVLIKDRQK